MSADKPAVGHVTIWVWLVVLLAVGVSFLVLPLPKEAAVVLIFAVATLKAFLVVRHYMHLQHQPLMVYVVLGVPVLLAIALVIVLMPDIAYK
jgi:cytochrome c oxidase subunit IV